MKNIRGLEAVRSLSIYKRSTCFALLIAGIIAISAPSKATILNPVLDLDMLVHVNRIAYVVNIGPRPLHDLMELGIDFDNLLGKALKESFGKIDATMPIDRAQAIPLEDQKKSGVLYINIWLSSREDILNSKEVNLASIALTLVVSEATEEAEFFPRRQVILVPVNTYPFILPGTPQDFEKKFKQGINYLTSYLPSYVQCAQKKAQGDSCGRLPEAFRDGEER